RVAMRAGGRVAEAGGDGFDPTPDGGAVRLAPFAGKVPGLGGVWLHAEHLLGLVEGGERDPHEGEGAPPRRPVAPRPPVGTQVERTVARQSREKRVRLVVHARPEPGALLETRQALPLGGQRLAGAWSHAREVPVVALVVAATHRRADDLEGVAMQVNELAR